MSLFPNILADHVCWGRRVRPVLDGHCDVSALDLGVEW